MAQGTGLWCNGSTTGFGSVCLGSNPGKPTTKRGSIIIGPFFVYILLIYYTIGVIGAYWSKLVHKIGVIKLIVLFSF